MPPRTAQLAQMFDGLLLATRKRLTAKIATYLLHLLEFVPATFKVAARPGCARA